MIFASPGTLITKKQENWIAQTLLDKPPLHDYNEPRSISLGQIEYREG
jgi:hypothetical protein